MDRNLIYSKTPSGEEATRQRTRVVQRNLRMVLLQVDGQLSVAGLIEKIGNETLVLNALRELEKGGYVSLSNEATAAWEENKKRIRESRIADASQFSKLSNFDSAASKASDLSSISVTSHFSTFGKPVLPVIEPVEPSVSAPDAKRSTGPTLQQRISAWFSSLQSGEAKDLAPVRRVSWGKRIALTVLALLVVGFLGLFLFPYNSYRPALEAALEKAVGMPVRIAQVDIRLYPRPGLVLQGVQLGKQEQGRIGTVLIPQLLALTGSGRIVIADAQLSDVVLSGDLLANMPRLAEGIRKAPDFSLEHLSLKGVSLQFGDAALRDLSGEVKFAADGGQMLVMLESNDRALQIKLTPASSGTKVSVEASNWKVAETSPFAFSTLLAKGTFQAGRLLLENVDANVLDGSFQGVWILDWNSGMKIAGDGSLLRINAKTLSSALGTSLDVDGRLSGKMKLRAEGSGWQDMWSKAEGDLVFKIDNGALNGIDLGEASRRGGDPVRGGSTRFEHLTGLLRVDPKTVKAEEVELDAGIVRATGRFTVQRMDKKVDGNLQITIRSSVSQIRLPVAISGTLPTLQTEVTR